MARPASKKTVGIVSKPNKPEVAQILPGLIKWLPARGHDLLVDPETAPHADGWRAVSRREMGEQDLDYVIVLGGDGTFLSAARAVAKAGIPIVGVNLGALGFLTEVPIEELYPTLESIEEGNCAIDLRSMVHCEVTREGTKIADFDALNDIVVGKSSIARLNHCDVFVDKTLVSRYQADSLIVATPTGSTAYSLAAGGPILMPNVDAFVITPVSAHSLTHRPLVVPDSSLVEVRLETPDQEVYLTVDGQEGTTLEPSDRVRVQSSQVHANLVRISGRGFYDHLRSKLRWGS